MKIERLELYGYKRLFLSNIMHLVYTPTATDQLILGTNGGGKTSLLFELSPLPGHKSNYVSDGLKDITIAHRGSHYRLVSTIKNGKHSFVRDGIELNPGGTRQVQLELVRRDFNITPDLHAVLIGSSRFTEMECSERRKWITALSTADYTYALSVYKKMTSRGRDAQGALRHLKQRLTLESNSLKSLAELEGLEEKAVSLRDELTLLLSARTPGLPHYPNLSGQLDQQLARIEKLSRSTVQLIQNQPKGRHYQCAHDVEADVHRINGEVGATQTLLDRFTSEYSDMEAMVKSITGNDAVTIENVDLHITDVDEQIAAVLPSIELFQDLRDADYLRQDTFQIMDSLVALFNQLPDNSDRRFSHERMKECQARITEQQNIVGLSTRRLQQIAARLNLINSAKDTTCPQCSYIWREGYSQHEVEQNETWQTEHEGIIDAASTAIKREEAFLEEAEAYRQMLHQFRGMVDGYPRLRPLWDYLLENQCHINQPRTQTTVLFKWQRDVELSAKLELLRRKRDHLTELSMRQTQLGGAIHFSQRLTRLHDDIEHTTHQLQQLRLKAKDVRQYRDRLGRINETVTELEGAVREIEVHRTRMVDALRNQEIDKVVVHHQNDLALIQHQLTEKRALEGIVVDLQRDHDEVELEQAVWTVLSQALSPTDGLIAEQLTGFIGCLVAQLNSIIASIWTYDVQVQPCGLDSGELDYKFPIDAYAGGVSLHVDDIREGSKGQQQVINMAFQLTTMLYMGMCDYPLYLDEPGEGFDEQHRVHLMAFVKQLMASDQHSQLFMVSHYAATHGSLTGAEVMVLNGLNVTVPGEYNKHVVML